jgi:hypothetical protein
MPKDLIEYTHKQIKRIDWGIKTMTITFTDNSVLKLKSEAKIDWSDKRAWRDY